MLVERQDKGALVSGYLDTDSAGRAEAFDTVLVRSACPYHAEQRTQRLGPLVACDIQGDHGVRVRPRASPTARGRGYALGLLLLGQGALEQGDRIARIAPGDFVLYSGLRPFRLDLEGPYRYFVANVDQGTADLLRRAGSAVVNPDLPRSPGGRVLTAALAEIAQVAPALGPVTRQEMGEHVTAMLRTLVHEAALPAIGGSTDRVALLNRALDHIGQHLDADLTPDAIAAAQHISVRYLHVLFRQRGETVGSHIRRQRLNRIRRDLADPRLAHLPAYAVAARWGLPDPSHFSRLFRAEFAMSPREFRNAR